AQRRRGELDVPRARTAVLFIRGFAYPRAPSRAPSRSVVHRRRPQASPRGCGLPRGAGAACARRTLEAGRRTTKDDVGPTKKRGTSVALRSRAMQREQRHEQTMVKEERRATSEQRAAGQIASPPHDGRSRVVIESVSPEL